MSFKPELAAPPFMRAVSVIQGIGTLAGSDDADRDALVIAYALGACCPSCPVPFTADARAYALAVGEWFRGEGGTVGDLIALGSAAAALAQEASGVEGK